MNKPTFVDYIRQELESALHRESISRRETEIILDAVFGSITRIVAAGDEVKYTGFGTFHPKLIYRLGQLINVKMGLEPFAEVNRHIFSQFEHSSLFSKSQDTGIRVHAVGNHYKLTDKSGNVLYGLSEIAKMAGVSMPTACKYARDYKNELPIVDNGSGKKYLAEAAKIMREIKKRNIKYLSSDDEESSSNKEASQKTTYTLSEVSRVTKISLPSLCKYTRRYGHLIPALVSPRGRKLYTPICLEIFKKIKNLHMQKFEDRSIEQTVEDLIMNIVTAK